MPARTVYQIPDAYSGTYVLEFADPSFEGLEVTMGRHSFGAIDAAARLRNIDQGAVQRGELDAADWAALNVALVEFCNALISWNLVDGEGRDVPTDLRTVKRLDLVWVMQVFLAWVQALIGVEWDGIEPEDIPMEAKGP